MMKSGFLLFVFISCFLPTRTQGQITKHTYRFYNDFAVAAPQCGPALSQQKALGACPASAGGGSFVEDNLPHCNVTRTVYHTDLNWGLMYDNKTGVVGETYTISMYVRNLNWGKTDFSRILDFSNGLLDEGIYFKNTNKSNERCLNFYPTAVVGACPFFNTSTYYLLTFTRNAQTNIIDVYVDNTLFVSYPDTGKKYVGKAGTPIYVYRDDREVSCESAEANFAYLSFTNQFFTQQDINKAYEEICYVANFNSSGDFAITPNPSCSSSEKINVFYTGDIPASSPEYNFTWDWDGGKVISGNARGPYVISWSTPGKKNVTLTITPDCGNKIVNRKEVNISDLDISTTVQNPSCNGNAEGIITVQGIRGTTPYQYSIDSVNYQLSNVFNLPPKSYKVFIKDDKNCTVSKAVTIDATSISLQTIPDTTICEGQQIKLLTTSSATGFTWLPATALDNASVISPTASPAASTAYIVTATNGNCSKQDTVQITVIPKIVVNVTPDTSVDFDVPFQLTSASPQLAGVSGVKYAWSPPTGLSDPSVAGPVATLKSGQTYTVEITSPQGCSGTARVHLIVALSGTLYIPDVFTPNGDGNNDVLLPISKGIRSISSFKIFNRWGEVIFFTDQLNVGWDGKLKTTNAISGSYVWTIEGITEQDVIIKRKGAVLLIR